MCLRLPLYPNKGEKYANLPIRTSRLSEKKFRGLSLLSVGLLPINLIVPIGVLCIRAFRLKSFGYISHLYQSCMAQKSSMKEVFRTTFLLNGMKSEVYRAVSVQKVVANAKTFATLAMFLSETDRL